MLDLRQTKEYADYMVKIGWRVDQINGVYLYSKKLPILGFVIKIQRPEKLVNSYKLLDISRKHKAFYILIEPKTKKQVLYYLKNGFKRTKQPSLPSKTIYIDLTKSEKKLLAEMHQKTRYNIGLARRRGVVIKLSNDLDTFVDYWHQSAKKRGLYLSQKKEIESLYRAFAGKVQILLALKKKEILAGVLIAFAPKISYYMYAFSTDFGKRLFAPSLLVWEALRLSKKKGVKEFDFEGIYDKRFPLKTWKGFTRFKKGFGGREVEFSGQLRKWYVPF